MARVVVVQVGAGVAGVGTEYQFLMNFFYMGEDVPQGFQIGNAVAVTFAAGATPKEMTANIVAAVQGYLGTQGGWGFTVDPADIVMPSYTTGTS